MQLIKMVLVLEAMSNGDITFDYHYGVMREVYRLLDLIDSKETKKLHDTGIVVLGKKIKPFNNHIFFEKAIYGKNGIKVEKNSIVKFTISGDTNIINNIVKGLIREKTIKIDEVSYKLKDIEEQKKIDFKKIMLYKVRNPIVETIFDQSTKKREFLNPFDGRYYEAIGKNLLRKYEAVYEEKYKGDLYFEIENFCRVKKKMIKNINRNGYLIGYTDFELYIEADEKMQKVAYMLGLGQNNFLGMGNISYICGRNR